MSEKTKLIFLGPVPPPYMGPSVATTIILNSALAEVYDIEHLDTSDRRDLKHLGKLDIGNFSLAFRHYFELFWMIVRIWPSIVYIPISQTTIGYFRDAGFILISKLFGRKVVCHLRGGNFRNWLNSASRLTQFSVKRIHRLVDSQIVLGDCLKPLFEGVVEDRRLFVVPNGRDFPTFREKGFDPSSMVSVMFLSNFERTKGVLEFLHSIPKILKRTDKGRFVLAGNWHRDDVTEEIRSFLAKHRYLEIELVTPVDDSNKHKLLEQADIFVFPTYYPAEGHPWVIVEALAAGLAIVSTDQGAIRESVQEGNNGFLVRKNNVDEIASRVVRLIENDVERKKMQQSSRELYSQKFTEARLVENFDECISETLDA